MTDHQSQGGPPPGRDRLRELLDAVLADDNHRLEEMAGHAYSSPYHFSRRLSRDAGEPPVAMRRRVMLERAAWQLRRGTSVTEAAFAAGYDSVEGFSRAFARAYGHPPSASASDGAGGPVSRGWLPAPNGIHFHPPFSLWVDSQEGRRGGPAASAGSAGSAGSGGAVTAQLVQHDVDDTRQLLELAAKLPDDDYRRPRLPGLTVLAWDGAEESLVQVLEHHVWTKEVWVASILGEDQPARGADDPAALAARHDVVAGRWLAVVRDVERRDAWQDRFVDALCEPPESFVLAGVVAHVLTYAAHRRQLARHLLRAAGLARADGVDDGDPLDWLRHRQPTPEGDPTP